ncbi:MAG: DUF480 domain-containing protein [Planctomycetaceae bacterium]|nr:DUF480 domain-containing protein [Planctomycetaceae bacterium]
MEESNEKFPPVTVLSKAQRRVLGVLVEKGLTVPDSYPMTLKALTTGCNQKNNRDPITEYTEDDVTETIEQLRQMGLVVVVHTESGRTERYRHYLRHRIPLSEPQVAILTELLLRGRQQPGELRTRASRMVTIESQDVLRTELQGLIDRKLAQTNGPIDRRGVEVDHNLYKPSESRTLAPLPAESEVPRPAPASAPASAPRPANAISPSATPQAASPTGIADSGRLTALETEIQRLRSESKELRSEVDSLREDLRVAESRIEDLRRALGG